MRREKFKRLNLQSGSACNGLGAQRLLVLSAAAWTLAFASHRAVAAVVSTEWLGTGSPNTSWSVTGNWASGIPNSPARILLFGGGWSQTPQVGGVPSGSTTSTDNINGNITLNQFVFEPSTAAGVPDQSFILNASGTGSTARLLDNSGAAPSISVTSSANQFINLPTTFKSTLTSASSMTVTGASLTFNSTFLVEAANLGVVNLGGTAGKSVTFNGLVTDGTTVTTNNASRLAITGPEDINFDGGIASASGLAMDMLKQSTGTLSYNAAPVTYTGLPNTLVAPAGTNALFMDQGTVSVGTGSGSIGATNGSTTGLIAMGASGTSNLNTVFSIANPGVTVGNPIDSRFFPALTNGTKTIGGANTVGTATYSGTITLHDSATLTSAGGTVKFTGPLIAGSTAYYANETANPTTPGITVTGPGTVELDNTNTYTGPTAINSGTLRVDGAINAASAVSVGNATVTAGTPTLSGTGFVNGPVTVSGSGTVGQISAGDSGVGTLTTGALTLNPAAGLDLTLGAGGASQSSPGVSNMLAVNGTLSLPSSGAVSVSIFGSPTNGWYKIATQTGVSGGNPTFNNTFSVASSPLVNKAYTFFNNGNSEIDMDITNQHGATATFGSTLPGVSHFSGTSHPSGANDVNVVGSSGNYVAGYLNGITGGDNGGATGYVTIGSFTPGDAELVALAITVSDTAGSAHSLSSNSDPALGDIVNDLRNSVGAGVSVYEYSGTDPGLALPAQYAATAAALSAGEAANGGKTFDVMLVTTDPQYLSLDFSPELNSLDGITGLQVTDIAAVPEPTTIGLGLIGAIGLLRRRRRVNGNVVGR